MEEAKNAKFDWVLFLIVLFFGWLGVDKFYKKDCKMGVWKLLLNLVVVGEVWNIYDLVCVILGKYKVNPLKKE